MISKIQLPIDDYLNQILSALSVHSNLLINASPGSGKTTRLPWAIAQNSKKKVLVLEPRKLAAKMAAQRIAQEEGLKLGKEIGHHFRFDKNTSPETRLIFYTEGTFLKMISDTNFLSEVGTIILDEFHERHLETDLALAYLLGVQKRRSDLKIIIMSATLDHEIQKFIPNAKLIEIQAKRFHVELNYLPNQPSILNEALPLKIKKCLHGFSKDLGDVLIFVPGMKEMIKTQEILGDHFGEIFFLHGDLSKEEQEKALGKSNQRKIILATNIAESSVTIPGIKVVIDSGIQRTASYSAWTGLKFMIDSPITQSSAIQRAGRAGRISEGFCFRLYSEQDFNEREKFTIPEILNTDLTDTYLLVKDLNSEFLWPTEPPSDRWKLAKNLLQQLGAISAEDKLTTIGKEIIHFPLSARLSKCLQASKNSLPIEKRRLVDFIAEHFEKDSNNRLRHRLRDFIERPGEADLPVEKALLYGFIDQVSKYRPDQHDFIHYSGKIIKAHAQLGPIDSRFYLILEISKKMEAISIFPIEEEWLFDIEPFPFTEEKIIEVKEQFKIKRQTKLGSILIDESILQWEWPQLDLESKNKILAAGQSYFQKRWELFKQTEDFLRLHFWMRFHQFDFDHLEKRINLQNYFIQFPELNWDQLDFYFEDVLKNELSISAIDMILPKSIKLKGQKILKVHYPFGLDPFVESHIQDFFGISSTPTILEGKVPLTLKLLGPHKMPIQITRDLKNFWAKTYQEMKKEWAREYPRHFWPESPEQAPPVLLRRQLIN
jgi:ATP-dependent helicase HrpB